jgi:hypothetical protein
MRASDEVALAEPDPDLPYLTLSAAGRARNRDAWTETRRPGAGIVPGPVGIGAGHARDLLHDAILDEEIMTLRHKLGVLATG